MGVKEKQYLKYIYNHRKMIKKVWETLNQFLKSEFWLDDYYWFSIDSLIKKHDKSKYGSEEFEPYRCYFYPEINEGKNLNWFNSGWNNHQKRNKHHWQYWVLIEDSGQLKILEIPVVYIIEMLCDWTAMSLFYKNLPSDWYNENKNKIMLEQKSRICVERWLPLFDRVYEKLEENNMTKEKSELDRNKVIRVVSLFDKLYRAEKQREELKANLLEIQNEIDETIEQLEKFGIDIIDNKEVCNE